MKLTRLCFFQNPTTPSGRITGTVTIPDIIKESTGQHKSVAENVYDVAKDKEDDHLGMDGPAADQGHYVDITDDITGTAVYSVDKATPGINVQGGTPQPAAEYFILENVDPADGDYNRLIRDDATHNRMFAHDTDNRMRIKETCDPVESTCSGLSMEYCPGEIRHRLQQTRRKCCFNYV